MPKTFVKIQDINMIKILIIVIKKYRLIMKNMQGQPIKLIVIIKQRKMRMILLTGLLKI